MADIRQTVAHTRHTAPLPLPAPDSRAARMLLSAFACTLWRKKEPLFVKRIVLLPPDTHSPSENVFQAA